MNEISLHGEYIKDGVLQTIELVRDLLDELEEEIIEDE